MDAVHPLVESTMRTTSKPYGPALRLAIDEWALLTCPQSWEQAVSQADNALDQASNTRLFLLIEHAYSAAMGE